MTSRDATSSGLNAGDLAVARKGCPACGFRAGMIFTVLKVEPNDCPDYECSRCHCIIDLPDLAVYHSTNMALPLSWCKRIPPLSELEGAKQKEDIREPA